MCLHHTDPLDLVATTRPLTARELTDALFRANDEDPGCRTRAEYAEVFMRSTLAWVEQAATELVAAAPTDPPEETIERAAELRLIVRELASAMRDRSLRLRGRADGVGQLIDHAESVAMSSTQP